MTDQPTIRQALTEVLALFQQTGYPAAYVAEHARSNWVPVATLERWRAALTADDEQPPVDRAAVLREAAAAIEKAADEHLDYYVPQGLYDAAERLRCMADEAQP